MSLKSKIIALALSAALGVLSAPIAPVAHAADSTASTRASDNLSIASGMVISGSVGVLAASGELIVVGVEQSGRGVSVVVKNVGDASGEIVTVLINGAAAALMAIGSALQASATGVGYVLVASGKAIAFIPNEIGQSLLHQSAYSR
ncbi:MAG: hypothetical protein ABL891_17110 [Burkholderiales bacterium]